MKNRGRLGRFVGLSAAVVALIATLPAVAAETISGKARVIDGDSLHIGDAEIRLFGIDAFERWQQCEKDRWMTDCGALATRTLRALVRGDVLVCEKKDVDSYGRTVAVCRNGNVDVGARMVEFGYALAYREHSMDYVAEEKLARGQRHGAWDYEFDEPWHWRRENRDGLSKPRSDLVDAAPVADRGEPGPLRRR